MNKPVMTPTVGMPVKLRKGMLRMSARTVQRIVEIKKLTLDEDDPDRVDSQANLDAEGGYWIKTSHTKGEWWAWSLFRVA